MSAIQPKPTAAAQAVASTAPDGATHKGGMLKKDGTLRRIPVREKGTAISLTMPQALLDAADEAAESRGLSRASFIKLAISEAIQK